MKLPALVSNATLSLLETILSRGSLVVASMILARNLDTRSFAEYGYFQLTVSMLGAYGAIGLGIAAARYGAEHSHSLPKARRLLALAWALSVAMGFVLALVVALVPEDWIGVERDEQRWLLSMGVLAIVLGVVPAGGALGLERYLAMLGIGAASAVTVVLGALLSIHNASPMPAMLALVISFVVQALSNTLILMRAFGYREFFVTTIFKLEDLRQLGSLVGPMALVTLFAATGPWALGRLLLAGPGGVEEFAKFTIGMQWFSLALLVPGMVSRVTLPAIVRLRGSSHAESIDQMKATVKKAVVLTVAASILVGAVGSGLAPWIIGLYGQKYAHDWLFIAAFLAASVLSAPANTLGNAIIAQDGQLLWLRLTIASFAMLLGVGLITSSTGIWSAVLALASSSLMLTVSAFFSARRRGLI